MLDSKKGAEQIIDLLNSPERLEEMKKNCRKLSIADSAENIFRLAQKIYSENE